MNAETIPGHCTRFLLPFDTRDVRRIETDFLVIGSGNAGLRATVELAEHGRVLVLSKENPDEGSTRYAQGGIAVVMNKSDRVEFHIQDTLKAGAGICDREAVEVLVVEGIRRVEELIQWGAAFDREGEELVFGMEGAHRVRRVVHRGDATGEETENVLVHRALSHPNVTILPHTFATDLLTENGVCYGALGLTQEGELLAIFARATVLAAGGLGQLYGFTSNPAVATGDGLAMAFRAGARLIDMEFVQFHPTTLCLEGAPRFLISEAVRGEGAALVNSRGERFMVAYDEREELAPRDVVSRAIVREMQRTGYPCVYLDITHRTKEFLENRFPTIYRTCHQYGLEIWRDAIPVQTAAHFMMGGVWTDLDARTTLDGLFACGEVACTGVHGANRLASNSLLEGLVFGERAGRNAVEYAKTATADVFKSLRFTSTTDLRQAPNDVSPLRKTLTQVMWEHVGILRNERGLRDVVCHLEEMPYLAPATRDGLEYANMRLIGELIARAALARTESRGAHYREDFPDTDDPNWKRHLAFVRSNDGQIVPAPCPESRKRR